MKVGVAIADITIGHVRGQRHPRRADRGARHRPGAGRGGVAVRRPAGVARQPRHRGAGRPAWSRSGSATRTRRWCRTRRSAAADGFVNLAVGSDEQFRAFCAAGRGARSCADDPRYATNAGRVAEREPSSCRGCRRCSRRARWPSGSRCSTARACRAARSGRCRRWRRRRRGRSSTTRTRRPARCARSARRSRSTASTRPRDPAPPTLGQHTDEVLRELGYDGGELAELLAGPCRPG